MNKFGTVGICGNFKATINLELAIDRFPLPRIEEVLSSLQGGTIFTKLNLAQAYM